MNGFITSYKLTGVGQIWVASTPKGICKIGICKGKREFIESLPSNISWSVNTKVNSLKKSLGASLRAKPCAQYVECMAERSNPKGIATPGPFKMGWARNDFFGAPLDLSSGTPFQQKVWRQILKIPKGETRSYAWLAKMAGRPRAVRAAANACGTNPIPLIIPCLRVIRSDGTIGGFSGPLNLKKRLLQLEGIRF